MGLRGRAESRGGWSRTQSSDVGGGGGDVDMGGSVEDFGPGLSSWVRPSGVGLGTPPLVGRR